ncbi:MAG: hypothetical protein P4L31_06935 [Candidatus Babeliales bacterium]|nr:hypothetical protein [Candidatus Babeliales bacterium]
MKNHLLIILLTFPALVHASSSTQYLNNDDIGDPKSCSRTILYMLIQERQKSKAQIKQITASPHGYESSPESLRIPASSPIAIPIMQHARSSSYPAGYGK